MAGNRIPGAAVLGVGALHVQHHGLFDFLRCGLGMVVAKELGIPAAHGPGAVIGLAPEHDAVDLLQMALYLRCVGDATVDHNL